MVRKSPGRLFRYFGAATVKAASEMRQTAQRVSSADELSHIYDTDEYTI